VSVYLWKGGKGKNNLTSLTRIFDRFEKEPNLLRAFGRGFKEKLCFVREKSQSAARVSFNHRAGEGSVGVTQGKK